MKITERDIDIINWIEKNKGATIEQINKLFFTNYTTCSIRLKKLSDNKLLKVELHPVLGKKVYYKKKMPSFHGLVLNDFIIKYKNNTKFTQREFKIKNYVVDGIIVLKTDKIIIVEIDIWNSTKKKKIEDINHMMKEQNVDYEIWIVSKRNKRNKIKGINYIIL
ncbi:hypothetical protein [Clostridium tetani]|uniref:hypothetical protein n=1 Tax=Clostridium tetani TaxID=1513 RepID=UPI001027A5FF|nr:hypothetical protein [Clostridium tetani]RXI70482.1 hypothetical protein DP127_09280 [Clostridium tetani]